MPRKPPPAPPSELSRLLFDTLKRQGLSATQLAARIGCNRSHLYRWLNGECLPQKTSHLQGIARACGQDLQWLLSLVLDTKTGPAADPLWDRLNQAFLQIDHPADLAPGLGLLAEFFRVERAALYLPSPISLSCLWCAGAAPFDPGQSDPLVRLYAYAVDWGALVAKSPAEAIARAFCTRQPTEFADACALGQAAWTVVSPLLLAGQPRGCLVLQSAAPAFSLAESAGRLREVGSYLAELVGRCRPQLDLLGREHAGLLLTEIYRELHGGELPGPGTKAPLALLIEQADNLSRTLQAVLRQFRLTGIPFHDLSLQHIDPTTGTMLAVGTNHGRGMLPPALFEAATAVPCWEAFRTGKPVYRHDLGRNNPYSEGNLADPDPVLAIADLPFHWGSLQGTLGINSLKANPWSRRHQQLLAGFVRRFGGRTS
ncbi:MAG: helix-turn-helix domain-containing protein [Candidatus Latescibacteria bacterium]|nr:helix-turn-helix domain-containing protein [Candidatus Latescibacterota bacterium]